GAEGRGELLDRLGVEFTLVVHERQSVDVGEVGIDVFVFLAGDGLESALDGFLQVTLSTDDLALSASLVSSLVEQTFLLGKLLSLQLRQLLRVRLELGVIGRQVSLLLLLLLRLMPPILG